VSSSVVIMPLSVLARLYSVIHSIYIKSCSMFILVTYSSNITTTINLYMYIIFTRYVYDLLRNFILDFYYWNSKFLFFYFQIIFYFGYFIFILYVKASYFLLVKFCSYNSLNELLIFKSNFCYLFTF